MTPANKHVKVSVVMGVYNGGAELAPTLRSVLDQDFEGFEFIIVDDGSTDASSETLVREAARDPRIRLLRQSNAGLTWALIRGCELARGEYIARQDCGDRSYPERLAVLAKRLDQDRSKVMAASNYRQLAPDGEVLSVVKAHADEDEMRRRLLAGDESILAAPHHGCVMFRRDAYLQAGGYRAEFYFAQDVDLWTRMLQAGGIAWINQELYEAKYMRESISAKHAARQRALGSLIAQAVRARAAGHDEKELLVRARAIRPGLDRLATDVGEDLDYFVGSCLADRRDPAARRYLARVLARRPWKIRAWAKLALSWLPGR